MLIDAVIVVVVILLGLLVVYVQRERSRLRTVQFAERESISFERIYQADFASFRKEDVEVLWLEIADTLSVPQEKLRPNDRFDHELANPKGFLCDGKMEMLDALYRKRRADAHLFDACPPKTVYDYVTMFAKPVSEGVNQ